LKNVRVGVIGLEFGAKGHLPGFQTLPGVDVVAVADTKLDLAQKVALERNIPNAYGDWRKLIDSAEVDAVSVAIPPSRQAEVVCAAALAGKHVLCEKPFGMNVQEAQQMVKAAQKMGVAHAVDFEFRMEPGIVELRRLVRNGEVGQARRIDVSWLTGGRADPALRWAWQHDLEKGGGVLGAFGSHIVDYAEWIFGRTIDKVFARSDVLIRHRKDSSGQERKVTAEDSCDLLCELDGGITANVCFSNCYRYSPGHRIEILGDKGRVVYSREFPFTPDCEKLFIETDASGLKQVFYEVLPSEPSFLDTRVPPFRQIASRFIEAIHGKVPEDMPTFEAGLRVQIVMEAIQKSIAEGKTIRVACLTAPKEPAHPSFKKTGYETFSAQQ